MCWLEDEAPVASGGMAGLMQGDEERQLVHPTLPSLAAPSTSSPSISSAALCVYLRLNLQTRITITHALLVWRWR